MEKHAGIRSGLFGSPAKVVGRIGDIASKLPDGLIAGTNDLPWGEIKGMRIVVDHPYHGIDFERVWRTLRDDVPGLQMTVGRWMEQELGLEWPLERGQALGHGDDDDRGLGL